MNQIYTRRATLIAATACLVLFLANASLAAADLPKAWIDEALKGTDESVHLIIKNHVKSQLDWRSYYQDRKGTERRTLPLGSSLKSSAPWSHTDSSPDATGDEPTCSDDGPNPHDKPRATRNCSASTT